jgi:spore germination protein KB
MKLEKGVISSSQLMLLMLSFLQSMHLTINFAYVPTKHDIWLAVLAGFIITIFFALIYIAIAQQFPQKTLIEINDTVYGPYIGNLISAIYVWFFFSLLSIIYIYLTAIG